MHANILAKGTVRYSRMSPSLLWLVSPSILFLTYHHYLCPNRQTPNTIISSVRSTRICDMAISFMASHIGRTMGGGGSTVDETLCVWGFLVPSASLRAYYPI
eukprot:6214655-Pleurochrysis_carterae.AAC.2